MMEEIWKPIKGYEGIYQVSNLGRVRSLDRTHILKDGRTQFRKGCMMAPFETKDGYKSVRLRTTTTRQTCRIHRLVAQAFIANPNNYPYINHKDENKHNNSVDNLEWCTPKYNTNYGMTPQRISETHKNHPGLSKPVEQFTMDGKFIKSYPSSKEAQRQTGIKAVNIAMCCRGKYSQSGGYLWRYKE